MLQVLQMKNSVAFIKISDVLWLSVNAQVE